MKVTVITIVYNDEDGILRTLNSIPVSNGNIEIEIVVKDGGSTDRTVSIIKSFSEHRSIIFKSENDSGIYNAMNQAAKMALLDSDYIIYMNSGDEFTSTASSILDENIDYFRKFIDVLIFPISSIDESGRPIPVRNMGDYRKLVRRPYIPHQSTFVKTSLILKYNFDEKYKILADYDLFCRLLVDGFEFVNVVSEPLAVFSQGGVSSTHHKQLVFAREQSSIQREHFKKVYYGEAIVPLLKWLLLRFHVFRVATNKIRKLVLKF
jgi:putative colanic acid biosynthesis glycosyltransferase